MTQKLHPKTYFDPKTSSTKWDQNSKSNLSSIPLTCEGGCEQRDKHVTLSFTLVTVGTDALGERDMERTRPSTPAFHS